MATNHSTTERRGSGLVVAALVAFTIIYAALLLVAAVLGVIGYVNWTGSL